MAMTIHSIHVSSRKIVSQLFFTVLLYLYFPLIVNVFRGVLASNFCCCFTYFFTLLAAVTFSASLKYVSTSGQGCNALPAFLLIQQKSGKCRLVPDLSNMIVLCNCLRPTQLPCLSVSTNSLFFCILAPMTTLLHFVLEYASSQTIVCCT